MILGPFRPAKFERFRAPLVNLGMMHVWPKQPIQGSMKWSTSIGRMAFSMARNKEHQVSRGLVWPKLFNLLPGQMIVVLTPVLLFGQTDGYLTCVLVACLRAGSVSLNWARLCADSGMRKYAGRNSKDASTFLRGSTLSMHLRGCVRPVRTQWACRAKCNTFAHTEAPECLHHRLREINAARYLEWT